MVRDGRKRLKSFGSTAGTVLLVLVLFGVFILSVRWFRSSPAEEDELVSSIVDVMKPDPISQAVIEGAIDTQSREAIMRWMATGDTVGTAVRGEKDDGYYLELTMQLPEIDREVHYYQVWLLRRLPYDFFSLGEMVTDEEGKFVLEWEPKEKEDYFDYTEIIITRNQYQGSSDPEVQVAKGEFGL